ncbi:MAG: stage II sporulation protein M [Spirochaetes bacterium]|nr:stage II sporulation protein M [Spirochaetota bacterium]
MENEILYVEKNKERWKRLEKLLRKKKKDFSDVQEFGELYLVVSNDLSYCQTHFPNSDITYYLNHLVRQCHAVFFGRENTRSSKFFHFFMSEFPLLLYELRFFICAAIIIFIFSVFFAWNIVASNVLMGEIFLPEKMYEIAIQDLELRRQFGNFDQIPENFRSALSLYVWFHNSIVAINCWALGIIFGLGTVSVLFYNGTMLGALCAVYYANGHFLDFISLIMIHGSLELPAIVIAGGAGIALGFSLIRPTRMSRLDAIRKEALRSLKVLGGVLWLLLIAAIFEGLITPLKLPVNERIVIVLINMVLLGLYIARGFVMMRDMR